jgi:hypothetical protein
MANQTIVINKARVSALSLPERVSGFTHRFNVLYTDVNTGTGSSDTVTLTLGTTPTQWIVAAAMVNVTTAFAGTTAFTLVVGTTTNTGCFTASTSVLTAGAIVGASGQFVVATTTQATLTTAVGLQAIFTNATGGSPSALTAGALDIYLAITNLQALDNPQTPTG